MGEQKTQRWWTWHCPQIWPMWIPPGNGHCAGREVSETQLPGRLENNLRQHFQDSLEQQEWWELCLAKILGMRQKKGKGWVQDDPMLLQGDPEWGFCIPLLAAQHEWEQLYLRGRGVPRWLQALLCSWGVAHSMKWLWQGSRCHVFNPECRNRNSAHLSMLHMVGCKHQGTHSAVDRCQLWGQPQRGVPCFRIGHHVTWFVSFCDFDCLHVFLLCCALLLQSRVKVSQNI